MRALRILLIVAVVLGGILVGIDRLAVAYAESEASSRVKLSGARADAIDVDIKGFPFLTQVADKRFDEVDVTASGVRATAGDKDIRVGELTMALRDVTVTGDWAGAKAGSASGTALVSYADLTAASDRGATVAYGGDGKVKVTGSVKILGRSLTRSVLSTVTVVNGDTLKVRADEVPGAGLPGVEELVRERTDFERPIGTIAGLKVERVEPRPDGLAVMVTGKDVVLAG
ncbi:LmeA family phospholipid-binding protein [Streptomyces sp. NPDC057540]|uniref:LmeA family phospholipid-binding protein n=1 Tax=Streptomyces sp. NPDC057540 TaxID=3346160 RepID=UPI0036AE962C